MAAPVERWTDRSGVRIRALDNAPADPVGLPVVFSPGFTDVADEYAELLEFFAPRRALVVEVRGRGMSEAPEAGYGAADHAADLLAAIDTSGIARFHMMTFSRGTTWALDVVLRDPARVGSVSIGDYRARELAMQPEQAEQAMGARFRGRPMAERVPAHVIPSVFAESQARDLVDDLAATGLPVLVATGTEPGCMLDATAVDEYRRRIPGVEVAIIAAASHDLFRPDRNAYPRAVAEFIARRAPDSS